MSAGRTLRVDEVGSDERLPSFEKDYYAAIGVASLVSVPLAKSGRFVAFLSAQQNQPRTWTDEEVRLIEEVADRTWSTIERVRAEAALRDREAQLAAFMSNAPASMYLKDEDGRYVLANDDVARRLGVAREAVIGRTLREIARPEIAEVTEAQEREVLSTGRAITSEQSFELAQGTVHALATRFPVPDAEGRLTRVGGMLVDITEQKRAEADLERARERLYQSEKLTALGSLLAGVAHELNNPLSIVSGEALMLEEDAAGTPMAEGAANIRDAAERCSKIVATFLAMARQKPARRVPTDLNAVAQAALDLAAYGLRGAGVRVTRELAPGLSQVSGDPDQLHQVVLNLLVNAQQALEGQPQPRELTLRTCVGNTPGTIVLEVADNGPGVPGEVRRRIWEPYFTTKPQGSGTGIGLSFSRGIVEAHGGSLDLVETMPGTGANFRMVLLAAGKADTSEADVRSDRSIARGTVLVVDDEPALARTLARLVERLGWTCEIAVGGSVAMERLAARDYDAVLCDVRMPDVDGPALLAWLVAERPHLVERLGFVTGDTLGAAAAAFLAASGRPSVEKPFTREAVAALLVSLVGIAGEGGRFERPSSLPSV
jgi:PAS domain S-box-containing protein